MLAALIAAMIAVESGGNPNAIGDGGQAIGVLQIHQEVVEDVNRVYGLSFTHEGMRDPANARRVCILYLQHYGRVYEKNTGAKPTQEVFARIWNGGPRGWQKAATIPYWNKVREQLP